MTKKSERIGQIISRMNRRKLHNNTQRVLLALLIANGSWVSRTSLKVPSAPARIRELRTEEFGSFKIECASGSDLRRSSGNAKTRNPTYYRLSPRSAKLRVISKLFEGTFNKS